jgi:hypothetical protein
MCTEENHNLAFISITIERNVRMKLQYNFFPHDYQLNQLQFILKVNMGLRIHYQSIIIISLLLLFAFGHL